MSRRHDLSASDLDGLEHAHRARIAARSLSSRDAVRLRSQRVSRPRRTIDFKRVVIGVLLAIPAVISFGVYAAGLL